MGNVTAKTSGDIASFMTPAETNIKSLKVHFSPKQLGTGDPSPENVREIVGWDGVEVVKSSVNLLDQSYILKASRWILSSDDGNTMYCGVPVYKGTIAKLYQKFKSSYPFVGNPFKENVQYNVSAWLKTVNGNSIQGLKFGFKYTDGTSTLHSVFTINDTWKRQTLTSEAGKTVNGIYCSYNKTSEIYLCGLAVCEKKFDDTSVVYPSGVNNISVDWSDNIGTIHGGYIDLISGELVEEYSYLDLSNLNWDVTSQVGVFRSDDLTNYYVSSITNFICNKYITTSRASTSIASMQDLNIKAHDVNDKYIYIKDTGYTDVTEFKSSLIDCNMVYLLATPITHQLTPTQLSSFIGQNNFWSNADYVEIEYELKETEDIQKARKKIMLNQPYVETLTGDVVSFATDMKAPLKECKVYFEPVQEGEGDPSPDNVRPISGWTGMEIQHTGENLFDQNEYLLADATKVEDAEYPDTYTGNKFRFYHLHGDVSANPSATGLIPMKPYGQLTISYYKYYTPSDRIYFHYTDAEAWVNHTGNITTEGYKSYTSVSNRICDGVALDTSQGSTATFKIGALQIKVGDKTTEYEPYQGQTIPINWQSEIGIVYGGMLDVLNGKLMVTNYYCTPDNATRIRYGINSESNLPYAYFSFAQKANGYGLSTATLCSMYKAGNVQNVDKALRMWTSEADIWDSDLDVTSLDTVKAYFADLIIVYPLAEPITIQLTPQQLLTLKGVNNIWSDTNGQTEVKFWTH